MRLEMKNTKSYQAEKTALGIGRNRR